MNEKEEKKHKQLIRKMRKNRRSIGLIAHFDCPKCGCENISHVRIWSEIDDRTKIHSEFGTLKVECNDCKEDFDLYQIKMNEL